MNSKIIIRIMTTSVRKTHDFNCSSISFYWIQLKKKFKFLLPPLKHFKAESHNNMRFGKWKQTVQYPLRRSMSWKFNLKVTERRYLHNNSLQFWHSMFFNFTFFCFDCTDQIHSILALLQSSAANMIDVKMEHRINLKFFVKLKVSSKDC